MITPEYLKRILEELEDETSWLNAYLLEKIVKRIKASFDAMQDDLFIPATLNDLHKLIDANVVYSDILLALESAMPNIKKDIRKAFRDSLGELNAYTGQIQKDIKQIKQSVDAGVVTLAEVAEETHIPVHRLIAMMEAKERSGLTIAEKNGVNEAYKRVYGEIHNYTHTTASAAQADYIKACDEAWLKVKAGTSINTAVIEAVDSLAKKGITCVQYGNIHTSIEAAVARAVRTGINQANAEMIIRRCCDMGITHVLVSQHLGARVTKNNDYTNHAWWQGKVYHLDFNKPELATYGAGEIDNDTTYPDFVDTCGWGDIQGICGINCRHTFSIFMPGINSEPDKKIDNAENEKRYEAEQKARAMERGIRALKRRIMTLKAIDTDEAKAKLAELNAKLDMQWTQYVTFCDDNGLKINNRGIHVGGY